MGYSCDGGLTFHLHGLFLCWCSPSLHIHGLFLCWRFLFPPSWIFAMLAFPQFTFMGYSCVGFPIFHIHGSLVYFCFTLSPFLLDIPMSVKFSSRSTIRFEIFNSIHYSSFIEIMIKSISVQFIITENSWGTVYIFFSVINSIFYCYLLQSIHEK